MTRKTRQTGITLAAVLFLSACSTDVVDGVTGRPFAHWCDTEAAKIVKAADWSQAKTVNLKFINREPDSGISLTVRTDVFEPQMTTLVKDRPYILKITNTDDISRAIYASGFFSDIAIAKVVNAGKESKSKCIFSITVPSKNSAEVHFVASKSGLYEIENNPLLIMPGLGPVAFITIK